MTPAAELQKSEEAKSAELELQEQALIAAQDEEFDSDLLTVPLLKVGQALTREVQNEQAVAGEFINTLTGEGIGKRIGFIVGFYNKGRFAADDDGKSYLAFGKVIPDAWEPLVGAEWVGTPFSEYPDAEEDYKRRANAKEISWGRGPRVSTTHNYTGYAIPEGAEGVDVENLIPVRLSLKRTDVPAARKINTLKRVMLRNKPFYDLVFDLWTEKKDWDKGSSHVINVSAGRQTTQEERTLALEIAQAATAQRVNIAGEDSYADAPSEPDARGGLDVG